MTQKQVGRCLKYGSCFSACKVSLSSGGMFCPSAAQCCILCCHEQRVTPSHRIIALFQACQCATMAVYLAEAAATARAAYAAIVNSLDADESSIYTINTDTMQKAAAHRLQPDALLHQHLAALQHLSAVPNVEVSDEQPRGQAAQQPPPQWTSDSVVLPGIDPPEQGSDEWLPPPPPRPAQPAKLGPADVDLPGVDKSEQDSDEWLPPPTPKPAQPASAIAANNADAPSQKRQRSRWACCHSAAIFYCSGDW